MSWEKDLEDLRRRERLAEQMGGPEKVARQKERGKLDARERLRRLLDADSFREIGKIAGRGVYAEDGTPREFHASNFIFGRGRIDGRAVSPACPSRGAS
jgi:propionyl-CoA carboxylase beta chain